MNTQKAADVSAIQSWHAHVYFSPETRHHAAQLREWVGERFPRVRFGLWREQKIGPHTQPMYQIAFENADYAAIVPFLALNRNGLAVLVHPETGRERADHTDHALWMGAVLPLDTSVLREQVTL